MRPSEEIVFQVQQVLAARKLPDLAIRESFIENLIFLWHCMRASADMLDLAAFNSTDALGKYFEKHLEEEQGHDEWLKEDLLSIGVKVEETPVPAQVPSMVGEVMYHLTYRDPVALLGYMLVMEGSPAPEFFVKRLEKLYGKELTRTLSYHALHDKEHGAELKYQVDNLPPERLEIVRGVAVSTAYLYGLGLSNIAAKEVA
jgi:hypothetical protein